MRTQVRWCRSKLRKHGVFFFPWLVFTWVKHVSDSGTNLGLRPLTQEWIPHMQSRVFESVCLLFCSTKDIMWPSFRPDEQYGSSNLEVGNSQCFGSELSRRQREKGTSRLSFHLWRTRWSLDEGPADCPITHTTARNTASVGAAAFHIVAGDTIGQLVKYNLHQMLCYLLVWNIYFIWQSVAGWQLF